ncbi:MAG: tetratricopeptide repeat protein, partial [Microcystaceae cyanobacterium]
FLFNSVANGRSERGKQWQNLPNSGIAQFVGREEYLIEIEHILATDQRVVLQGMGGCGKSELALQYAWRQWHNQHYGGGICWLNAFEGDLGLQILNFAYARLGLEIATDGVLAERVALCWQNWPAGQVLMIIDDLRDYGIIEPYLPPLEETRFQVIITTRFNYLRHTIKTINLGVLAPESALALLNAYVTDDRVSQQLEPAKLLCQDLGYLPLALELVARLLRHQKNLTIQQVREQLREQGLADQSLQKNPTFEAEMTAQNGVKEAFDVSWGVLDSHAQRLAMYLSLFALAPFSQSLIEALLPEHEPEEIEVWLTDGLMNLSLVNDLGDDWYELHPLIRVYLREKLEASPLKEEAKRAYGRVMVGIAKTIKQTLTLADIANLEPYIEHLKVAAEEFHQWLEGEDLTWPFVGLGKFYRAQGLYQQAVPYFERCLTLSEQRFGQNHPEVAISLNNLAGLYRAQGKYAEAEPLHVRSLSIKEKNLGE